MQKYRGVNNGASAMIFISDSPVLVKAAEEQTKNELGSPPKRYWEKNKQGNSAIELTLLFPKQQRNNKTIGAYFYSSYPVMI